MFNDTQLDSCEPPAWARSGHSQTLFGHFLPSKILTARGKKVILTLPDSDQLILEIYEGETNFVALLFHGLTGCSQSGYIQRTAQALLKKGHTCVLVNHRGCGDGAGLAKRPYHSGCGRDISEVVQWARKNFKDKKISTIGFSLSANAILTLLTGQYGEHKPDFAIVANGPIDLTACSRALSQGLNRIYDLRFVQLCKKDIFERRRLRLIEFDKSISSFGNLADIDELYTAPQAGFNSAQHYYDMCSTFRHIQNIKTPTAIITAKDDPFISFSAYEQAQRNVLAHNNSFVHFRFENVGGHMGYLSRNKKRFRWLDYAIEHYFEQATKI